MKKIICHSTVYHLVPLALAVIENMLGIINHLQHFVSVVICKGESISTVIIFIVSLNRVF